MKKTKSISGERGAVLVLVALLAITVGTVSILWIAGDSEPSGSVVDGQTKSETPSDKPSNSHSMASASASSSSPSPSFKPGKNPYSAGKVCGGGYQPVDKVAVKTGGTKIGAVHLLYNAKNGKNCVVTMKAVDIEKKTPVDVWLEVKGGKQDGQTGDFGYYAGPVTLKAKATCVKFGGSVSGAKADSGGWDHCG